VLTSDLAPWQCWPRPRVFDPENCTVRKGLEKVVDEPWTEKNSWRTFTAALALGRADQAKNAERFQKGDDADYQLIPVIATRKIGTLPISLQSTRALASPPRVTSDSE
jgi:hypothetical protein